jgi:hypothetical protein
MNRYNDEPNERGCFDLIFWAVVITGLFGLIAYVMIGGGK